MDAAHDLLTLLTFFPGKWVGGLFRKSSWKIFTFSPLRHFVKPAQSPADLSCFRAKIAFFIFNPPYTCGKVSKSRIRDNHPLTIVSLRACKREPMSQCKITPKKFDQLVCEILVVRPLSIPRATRD